LPNGIISVLQKIPQKRDSLTDAKAPKNQTMLPYRARKRGPGRRPVLAYWLITKNQNGGMKVFTTLLAGGGEALPVFSYEQEAELFLGSLEAGSGWRVRESTAGELISVLYGPCARVKRVALDPLPEMVLERTVGFVSLCRERFVDLVLGREQPLTRREG